jgi:hypothetical protein
MAAGGLRGGRFAMRAETETGAGERQFLSFFIAKALASAPPSRIISPLCKNMRPKIYAISQ